jgi:hypothetical protein
VSPCLAARHGPLSVFNANAQAKRNKLFRPTSPNAIHRVLRGAEKTPMTGVINRHAASPHAAAFHLIANKEIA